MKILLAKFAYWLLKKTGWRKDVIKEIHVSTVICFEDLIERSEKNVEDVVKERLCKEIAQKLLSIRCLSELRYSEDSSSDARIYTATAHIMMPPILYRRSGRGKV